MARRSTRPFALAMTAALVLSGVSVAGPGSAAEEATQSPVVEGPLPGTAPGDPASDDIEDTYPFFSTTDDLARAGYVEEEFILSGSADAYETDGTKAAADVPYRTRIVVRRPTSERKSNGVVLMEWQNVTAGYDLDALWNAEHVTRNGYTWVGVSAQRVGVDMLRGWSPARYGDLDVTGGGAFMTDQLSYDVFAQAANAVRSPRSTDPMGGLRVKKVLGIGASQSASRMTVYYDRILPQTDPVFDGYGFIVGSAPTRVGPEPVFHVLSETDVRTPEGRRADSAVYRRWEVAGAAHSGWSGQEYRAPLSARDLPTGVPDYHCDLPPFSRVPLHHVVNKAYDHLVRWVDGRQPPHAPYLQFDGTTKVRNALGLAQGGIQLSQVSVPTSLDTGDNTGESFCFLFGSHQPFDATQLRSLYRTKAGYIARVTAAGAVNVAKGYVDARDALADVKEAVRADIGRR